jgi:hypothetical protein
MMTAPILGVGTCEHWFAAVYRKAARAAIAAWKRREKAPMQRYASLDGFLRASGPALSNGPVALIFAEDTAEIGSTLKHHLDLGFRSIVLCLDRGVPCPEGFDDAPLHVLTDVATQAAAMARAVTLIQARAPAHTWFFWCYNAEYLFFPFCETRRIGEMLAFHTEERRRAMIGFAVDLYAPDLSEGAVSRTRAHLDRTGYYALTRTGPDKAPLDRQMDFYGGLRWRFEEHVPKARRRIDRVALFRSRPKGLDMRPDATFSEAEYNTFQCPWHHNLTCVIASFRTAKALTANPGSRHAIDSFRWRNSQPFTWSSRQLMDLGLMEPGQWF